MAVAHTTLRKKTVDVETNDTLDSPDMENDQTTSEIAVQPKVILVVYILLVVLGIGTGFFLSRIGAPVGATITNAAPGKAAGSTDTRTFKDSAVGTLEKGGLDGEGTHKLIRDGGPSQTVYLVSSVVDLDEFTGKKVTVWGQTIAAEKAAWLMDVGKIEAK